MQCGPAYSLYEFSDPTLCRILACIHVSHNQGTPSNCVPFVSAILTNLVINNYPVPCAHVSQK